MKLTEMKQDMHGIVKGLNGDDHFLKKVTSIGLTENVPFQIVRNDPKMPVLLYVRETLLALNRKDCERIEAEVIR
ncbi:MAG: ferrous iron transport protein A [Solobacterium sp.]|nr:ferrous iron transport protein A [Solobacterium sp.]